MIFMPNIMSMTTLFAALLGVFFILLSVNVIRTRESVKVLIGDGGNETLQRAIRAQSNFVEYVPMALVMMTLLEMHGTPIWVIFIIGMMVLIGRTLHAHSLLTEEVVKVDAPIEKRIRYRKLGMRATLLAIGIAAILLLVKVVVV